MLQLALKLAELTENGLKALARAIKTGLASADGLAKFPTPKVTPAQLEAAAAAVEAQEGRVATAEGKLAEERAALLTSVTALTDTITAAATDCLNTVSQLPEAEARAALATVNVAVRGEREPSPAAVQPTNFYVNRGDHDHSVSGGCDRQKQARLYRVRYGGTANGPWTVGYEGTRSSFEIQNLTPGESWFQMAAFATNGGWSEWSDPARCHVL
jgi:hypothetical protein